MESWKANLRCYRTYRNRLYLVHHGIKGQKWGVRHGPPYPLDSGKRPKPRVQGSVQKKSPQINGPLDKYMEAGKMKVQELLKKYGKDPVPVFKMKLKPVADTIESIKEDLAAINPSGSKTNCVFCSVAYDMRRRGSDVVANPLDDNEFRSVYDLQKWYKKPVFYDSANSNLDIQEVYTQLVDGLNQYEDGARGVVTGTWSVSPEYGHAIAWQKTKSGVIFLDGQDNTIYGDPYNDIFSGFSSNEITYVRTDNLKIRPNKMKEAVRDAD